MIVCLRMGNWANLFRATDNAVSMDGAKSLVAYLEEYAKR